MYLNIAELTSKGSNQSCQRLDNVFRRTTVTYIVHLLWKERYTFKPIEKLWYVEWSTRLKVGMPLPTRCHCQCVDMLCQLFVALCKACFYVRFSIENEVYVGIFCPEMNHLALLPVQTCCFSAKIECCRKCLVSKFCLLFKTRFNNIAPMCLT